MNPGDADFSFSAEESLHVRQGESEGPDRKRRKFRSANFDLATPTSQTGHTSIAIEGRASGMMMGPPPPLGNPPLAFARGNQSSYQHQRQLQPSVAAGPPQFKTTGDVTSMEEQLLQLQNQAIFFGGYDGGAPSGGSIGKSMRRDESGDGLLPFGTHPPAALGPGERDQAGESMLPRLSQKETPPQHQQLLALQAQQQLLLQASSQSNFMTYQPQMNLQSGFLPLQQHTSLISDYNTLVAPTVSTQTGNALIDPNILGSGDMISLQDEKAQRFFDADTGTGGLFGIAPAKTRQEEKTSSDDDKGLAGRRPILLFMSCDEECLSEYQCLVRKQIEMFEAGYPDVESNAKGRNKPIMLGQVGIRCRHCSQVKPKQRTKGAMYYPAKLAGLYQAAQSLATSHLCIHCTHIPSPIRQELLVLKEKKSSAGGGKDYWGEGVRILGVFEDKHGLRFNATKKAAS